jgi:hypothetical protein
VVDPLTGHKIGRLLVSAKQAGNGKKWQVTPKQFAALNHLLNTIARASCLEIGAGPRQSNSKRQQRYEAERLVEAGRPPLTGEEDHDETRKGSGYDLGYWCHGVRFIGLRVQSAARPAGPHPQIRQSGRHQAQQGRQDVDQGLGGRQGHRFARALSR